MGDEVQLDGEGNPIDDEPFVDRVRDQWPLALVMLGMAVVATWFVATAGFGAALLSRAGLRGEFAGRIIAPESLTDEYLWATPQLGVTAMKRPDRKQ